MAIAAAARYVGSLPVAVLITLLLFWGASTSIDTNRLALGHLTLPGQAPPPLVLLTEQIAELDYFCRCSPGPISKLIQKLPPIRIATPLAQRPSEAQFAALAHIPEVRLTTTNVVPPLLVPQRKLAVFRHPTVRPTYPAAAIDRGLEGTCLLTFDLNPDGSVASSSVIADCTSPLFARAAINAARRWKYQPEIRGGQAVMSYGVQTELEFRLTD